MFDGGCGFVLGFLTGFTVCVCLLRWLGVFGLLLLLDLFYYDFDYFCVLIGYYFALFLFGGICDLLFCLSYELLGCLELRFWGGLVCIVFRLAFLLLVYFLSFGLRVWWFGVIALVVFEACVCLLCFDFGDLLVVVIGGFWGYVSFFIEVLVCVVFSAVYCVLMLVYVLLCFFLCVIILTYFCCFGWVWVCCCYCFTLDLDVIYRFGFGVVALGFGFPARF